MYDLFVKKASGFLSLIGIDTKGIADSAAIADTTQGQQRTIAPAPFQADNLAGTNIRPINDSGQAINTQQEGSTSTPANAVAANTAQTTTQPAVQNSAITPQTSGKVITLNDLYQKITELVELQKAAGGISKDQLAALKGLKGPNGGSLLDFLATT